MVAPLLEEIWVALRQPKYFLQCFDLKADAGSLRRLAQRFLAVFFGERTDIGEAEQPLRIRFLFSRQPGKDWQTRAEED